ncbi:MAG: hypothetical protein FGM54_01810 [Chitinophagaceae bacterium]|nr:hypothetical protein [Chitinophagaceae bacterium]
MTRWGIQLGLLGLFCMALLQTAQAQTPAISANRIVHNKPVASLSALQVLEDSLVYYADSMYASPMPESRMDGGYAFIRTMKAFLKTPGSFNYPCEKLNNKISITNAPDGEFRIYNWEVMRSDADARYYGVIQRKNGQILPLVDVSDQLQRGAEDSVLNNGRWFGCLYYNVIAQKLAGQTLYFLLGWNGNGINSERKVIDVLSYGADNSAVFGAPVFNMIDRNKRRDVNRYVLEYQRGSKVSMNWDEEMKQIILDHTESQIGDPAKRYTYVPDGSYDGIRWTGNKWVMAQNVIQIDVLESGKAPVEKPIK